MKSLKYRTELFLVGVYFWHYKFFLSRYLYCEKCFNEIRGDIITLEDAVKEQRFVHVFDFRSIAKKKLLLHYTSKILDASLLYTLVLKNGKLAYVEFFQL